MRAERDEANLKTCREEKQKQVWINLIRRTANYYSAGLLLQMEILTHKLLENYADLLECIEAKHTHTHLPLTVINLTLTLVTRRKYCFCE